MLLPDGHSHSLKSYRWTVFCREFRIIFCVIAVALVFLSADVRAGNPKALNCDSLEYVLLLNSGEQSIAGFDVHISVLPINECRGSTPLNLTKLRKS